MKQGSLSNKHAASGAALMAVLFIIAVMAAAVGAIYSVTTAEGRLMRRSVDRERAIAYGDGVVQNLFDQWRVALSGATDASQHGKGFTYNELMLGTATSPAVTIPSTLPLKAPTTAQIPVPVGLALVKWNVTPADPYLIPVTTVNPVTGEYFDPTTGLTTRPIPETGTNSRSRIRTNYIASAKVSYPGGSVIVQRPFVRSGRNIFDNFLFSTQHVTEIHPGAAMYVNGSVYAGGDLYTGTNNLNFQQDVTFTGNWSIAYLAGDPHASTPSSPTWPTGNAPHQGAQQKLLDTPLSTLDPNFTDQDGTNDTDSDGNKNNDGYHEILEELNGAGVDPLKADADGGSERLASNADYRIYVDASNNVTIYKGSSTSQMTAASNPTEFAAIMGAITTNTALNDGRENDNVRLVNVDVGKIATAVNASSTTYDTVGNKDGLLLYINDTSYGTSVQTNGYSGYTTSTTNPVTGKPTNGNLTTSGGTAKTSSKKRGVRLVNGGVLPDIGLTVATPNPVYVQGEYNSGATTNYSSTAGGTSTAAALTISNKPASDGGTAYPSGTSAPVEVSGTYTKKAAAIAADAVTILSNNWSDGNSTAALSARLPANTTVNAAIVAGNVPTNSTAYSGGIENFPRLLETWGTPSNSTGTYLTIHGSFGLLYDSEQATSPWVTTGNYYNAPSRRWFFDPILQDKNPPGFPVAYTYGMGSWALK